MRIRLFRTVKLPRFLTWLHRDRRGSMYMLTAFALPVLIGFGGMGIDVAMWYAERRNTQNIADAAAVAATYDNMTGGDATTMEAAARAEALRNGYVDVPENTFTIVTPSTVPPVTGTSNPVVDVLVRREVPIYMLGWFLADETKVAASATGGLRNLGTNCVISLHKTAARAVEFVGGTTAHVGCGVASNSNASDSLYIGGSAELDANPAQAHGDIVVAGGGTLTSTLPPMPYMPEVPDPFGNRVFPGPTNPSCDYPTGLVVSGTLTIGPSVAGGEVRICGNFSVQPSGNLTMQAGTYFVENGEVLFQGTVTGTDVTIVLTGSDPSSVGTIDIRASADVNLTAPATGPYFGIVIYQDRIADSSGANKLNGGSDMNLLGAVYVPKKQTEFAGGANVDGCTVLIATIVKFVGDSYIENTPSECGTVGLNDSVLPTQQQVVLIR